MRTLFRLLAASFFVTALFHLVRAASPGEEHAARHALFAAIDLAMTWVVLRRPRGATIAVALLTAQQIASHGGDLVRAWRVERRIDPSDVAVLVVLPLTLAALAIDARRRRATA